MIKEQSLWWTEESFSLADINVQRSVTFHDHLFTCNSLTLIHIDLLDYEQNKNGDW